MSVAVRSMTGYGRAERERDGVRVDVELRSVNHRFLELNLNLPRGLGAREAELRAKLQARIRRAKRAGADICKIAAVTSTAADLHRLLTLFTTRQPLPLSVMGMGEFGKVSRLLLARAGSVLNYGYLDRPNASGQWEARVLRERMRELAE